MKTLTNQTLLYDEDCPLCNVYTSTFIKTGMLDKNGRKSFSNLSKNDKSIIDVNRASNEIALIDKTNNTVIYGIESLLKVLGNSMPLIEKIGKIKPINFVLTKLYSFISFNRKVIMPTNLKRSNTIECQPTFNTKYRLFYIVFASLITTLVLFKFSKILSIFPESTILREGYITVGQILFQSLFLFKYNNKEKLNYFGHLLTVSLFGSLLLTPLLILNSILNLNEIILFGWFGIVVSIMFFEHLRRVKILHLPKYLSITWMIYRLVILFILTQLTS